MTPAGDEDLGRIEIEIKHSGEPIRGRVHGREGALSFSGWLGLAAALGKLMQAKPAGGTNEPTREEAT